MPRHKGVVRLVSDLGPKMFGFSLGFPLETKDGHPQKEDRPRLLPVGVVGRPSFGPYPGEQKMCRLCSSPFGSVFFEAR